MRFKPIPDSVRCATLEAGILVVARVDGAYKVYATDSDYVLDHIIEPALEDAEFKREYRNKPIV